MDLLDESNKYVKEAHESQRGHEILKEMNFLRTEDSNNPTNVEFDEEIGGRLAITVQDSMDINLESTVTNPASRKRQRPDRFADTMLQDDEEFEVTSDNSAAFLSDEAGDEITALKNIVLETTTIKKLRQNYSKLTSIEQEKYNQDKMNLRHLLRLSPTRIYIFEDLRR